jgi:tetratricopeptide (TPR) repeat protein
MKSADPLLVVARWLLAATLAAVSIACASAVPLDEESAEAEAWPTAPASDSQAAAPRRTLVEAASGPVPEESWSQLMKAGRGYLDRGELPEAEDRFTRAWDRTADFRDTDPRTAATLRNLERVAVAYRTAGDAPAFARVLELLALVSETTPAARTPELATLMQELAAMRTLQGRPEEARRALERTVTLMEEARGPEDASLAGVHAQLGLTLIELGDLDGAEREIDRAAEIGVAADGADGLPFARTLLPRARLDLARGRDEDARDALQTAIDIYVERQGENSPETARMVRELALFEQGQGEYAAAERSFDRAIAIWDSLPREDYQRAQSRNELAWFLVETGKPGQAEAPARSALGILEDRSLGGQPYSAVADTLATALRDQQKYEEAEHLYQRALEEGTQGGALPGWDLGEIAERYAVLLEETGRAAEAEALRARFASSTKVNDS